jgi:Xaa-Pro aminopeptidase
MNRRDALGTIAATGLASTLPGTSAAGARPGGSALHPPVVGPRMNFAQADKVMSQLGLDALVLGDGINFQQATGNRPVITRMGRTPSTFAIVSRREAERVTIVTAAFSYYYTLADVQHDSGIPAYVYTAAAGDLHENDTEQAAPLALFRDRGEVPTGDIERTRVAATQRWLDEKGQYSTIQTALAQALKDLGLSDARIAVDHPHVDKTVSMAAPKATTVGADDALRRIRPVKSANEIQLMRQAATGNVEAALEALKTVRAGGSFRDLRAEFYAAAARRGHRGVFMVIDRTSDELYENTLREGQAILIDCVSEYEGYHGDYGRTVFVGEPVKNMIDATNAMAIGWDSVREQLRPGLKFSDIPALGQAALRSANKSYAIPFSPHSVGLYHSDHVGSTGLEPREDIVLEPGMILSIDCPLTETGVGGSAHLEDLMLITADGAEPINDIGHQTITI